MDLYLTDDTQTAFWAAMTLNAAVAPAGEIRGQAMEQLVHAQHRSRTLPGPEIVVRFTEEAVALRLSLLSETILAPMTALPNLEANVEMEMPVEPPLSEP